MADLVWKGVYPMVKQGHRFTTYWQLKQLNFLQAILKVAYLPPFLLA